MAPPAALWVTPVPDIAGVGRHFLDVAGTGIPGWTVTFAAPEGALTHQLRAMGATVEPLAIAPGVPAPVAIKRFRRLIQQVQPTVVHTHLPRADLMAPAAGARLPIALISTEHAIAPDRLIYHSRQRSRMMDSFHRTRLRRFDGVIAVSEATRGAMQARWGAGEEVVVIRNGVDRPAPRQRQPGSRFLSLARLAPEKQTHFTLRAFTHILQAMPGATLTVAGIGPLEADLKRLAVALGISHAVSFPGFLDARQAMSAHDVVIQASAAENLSYTLLDAVAHGLGVAATRVGGNAEFLPEHCLVSAAHENALALVALDQATNMARRPVMPDTIPTVHQMTNAIGQVYAQEGLR